VQSAYARTTAMPSSGQRVVQAQPPVQYTDGPNRNGLYAALGFIAVIALIVGGIFLYKSLTKKEEVAPPTTVTVPNVVGMLFDDASKALSDAHLSVTPVPETNDSVAENEVFLTNPASGAVVELDSAVEVHYNPVKEPAPVPDVTGQNLEEAKRLLTEAQFVPGTVTSENSDKPKDTVIRTDPAATTMLKPGSPVAIVLSAGPNTEPIPNVEGQSQDAATQLLSSPPFNFVVNVTNENSDSVQQGRVIRTEPAIGGELAPGSPITIVVSSGVKQVQVPVVVGLTEAQAKNLLTSKGFTADVTRIDVPAGSANDGRVISQDPAQNTMANPGTQVKLTVGRAVAPTTTSSTTTTSTTSTTTTSTTTTTTTVPGP
jgi:serine/threonine-protein kinase